MLTNKIIPEKAFLYKEGLYINEYEQTVGSLTWTIWELFADEGYCFYDLQIPENYDEEGELKPANERVYHTYGIIRKDEQYVKANTIPVLKSSISEPDNTDIATESDYIEALESLGVNFNE